MLCFFKVFAEARTLSFASESRYGIKGKIIKGKIDIL